MGHRSNGRYAGSPSFAFLFSMAICAFVSWFIFFIVFKIRGEFFFFETSHLDIPVANQNADQLIYYGYREAAVAVGVVEDDEGKITLIIDDGKVFSFPSQKGELSDYVRERSKKLELMTMITKMPSRTIGRVQLWVERDVHFTVFHEIIDLFTQFGFDDFDLALSRPAKLVGEVQLNLGHGE